MPKATKKTSEIVTIDTSAIALIEKDGDQFLLDPRAEDGILAFIELKKRVDEVEKLIKEKLAEQMKAMNCIKIEGDAVKVARRYYGERYEIYDPVMAEGMGFAKKIVSVKPDAKAIDEYVKDTNELPEGIKLRERTESISFSGVKEK